MHECTHAGEAPPLESLDWLDAGGDLDTRTIPAVAASLPVRPQRQLHIAFGLQTLAPGRRGDPHVRTCNLTRVYQRISV